MRKVPLIYASPDEAAPTAAKIIIGTLEQPAGGTAGTTYQDMVKTIPLIEKLEKLSENANHILLEDAEWEHLKARLELAPWTRNDKYVYHMLQEIMDAETCDNQGLKIVS